MPKKIKATKKVKAVPKAKPIKKGNLYQQQRQGSPCRSANVRREEGEEEEGQERSQATHHGVLCVHQEPQGRSEKGATQALEHRARVGREWADPQKMSLEWRALTEKEKEPYAKTAAKDKERYNKEKKTYDEKKKPAKKK